MNWIKRLYLQVKWSRKYGWRWRSDSQLEFFEGNEELNDLLDQIIKQADTRTSAQ